MWGSLYLLLVVVLVSYNSVEPFRFFLLSFFRASEEAEKPNTVKLIKFIGVNNG